MSLTFHGVPRAKRKAVIKAKPLVPSNKRDKEKTPAPSESTNLNWSE